MKVCTSVRVERRAPEGTSAAKERTPRAPAYACLLIPTGVWKATNSKPGGARQNMDMLSPCWRMTPSAYLRTVVVRMSGAHSVQWLGGRSSTSSR
eukprot:5739363-Pyramimonas_sp.AAC.1